MVTVFCSRRLIPSCPYMPGGLRQAGMNTFILFAKVCHFRLKTIQITQEINTYIVPLVFAHLNFRILPAE